MKEQYFDRHIPVDQYGLSKYVMAKSIDSLDNVIDLRVFGCFGPHEDWEIRFISNAICKALYGLPISIRKNVFFDYLWVDDLVRIVGNVSRDRMRQKHYNACTGKIDRPGHTGQDYIGKNRCRCGYRGPAGRPTT